MILDNLIVNKFSMFEHARIMKNILALATPKKLNMVTLINYIILTYNLTLSQAEMLSKMSKIYKKTTK